MDNLKSPASPIINQEGESLEDRIVFYGFTKLEKAAIKIASNLNPIDFATHDSHGNWRTTKENAMAKFAVSLAKAVIEEANK